MSSKAAVRPVQIPAALARRLAVLAQGLGGPRFGKGKAGALAALEHIGYVQIDTIAVVERAHHHTFWARVPDYSPDHLHDLQAKDRKVFEYWSHAASYLPMRDFRYALPRMEAFAKGRRHWFRRDNRVHRYVLDRIKAEGPLRARDFEAPPGRRGGSWFEWKPAKSALEQLFWAGKLLVRERRRFEKVFDLPERVLPPGVDASTPTEEEFLRHLVLSALRAHGLAAAREISYLRRIAPARLKNALACLAEAGEIIELAVEGISGETYYALPGALDAAAAEPDGAARVLSPFDNLVIQRRRLARLFSYDFQIEFYLPEAKRRYGYFSMPILRGTEFIARVDAKADRPAETLLVRNFHWETPAAPKPSDEAAALEAVNGFAAFNNCRKVLRLKKLARPR